jgi:hypothetical protein
MSSRRRGQLGDRRVRAGAILVQAVARNVDGERPHGRIVIVAVAAAEERAGAVVIAVGETAQERQRQPGQRGRALDGSRRQRIAPHVAGGMHEESEGKPRAEQGPPHRNAGEKDGPEVRAEDHEEREPRRA